MQTQGLRVSKFGGTSMADEKTMGLCADVVLKQKSHFVVVSATSGTTNLLIELGQHAEMQDTQKMADKIEVITARHTKIADHLQLEGPAREALLRMFSELKDLARGIHLLKDASDRNMDSLVSLGERLSSLLFTEALRKKAQGLSVEWLDARHYIRTDDRFGRAQPLLAEIAKSCEPLRAQIQNKIFVTQGFIGATLKNQTTTLGRGGSDFSAALFAEGLKADVLEIWTDVAGIATTDPRLCSQARMIPEISFTEASELATFGAKVLHPATLMPAMRQNIPVFVGSSFAADLAGTWVRKTATSAPLVRAMALRRNQRLLTLTTPQMWQTHGFLYQIFKVFNDHKISVDAITTSEISVSLTLDASEKLSDSVIEELKSFADVQIESGLSLISLIGNNINFTAGVAEKTFGLLKDTNIRMICQGASRHNFCFLVEDGAANGALQKLHSEFIEKAGSLS